MSPALTVLGAPKPLDTPMGKERRDQLAEQNICVILLGSNRDETV